MSMRDKNGRHRQPDTIGTSVEGRSIGVEFLGPASAKLRVLIVAGQHGDESLASRAVAEASVGELKATCRTLGVNLAVIPSLNPDGAAVGRRHNAFGVDLNRDHLLLTQPETRALHDLVDLWRPHVVVDVHCYPPRRKHLLDLGWVYAHDVFVDAMNHPAACHPLANRGGELVNDVLHEINDPSIFASRYFLVRPDGRVRRSTTRVVDARNGLAVRFPLVSLLIEGRKPERRLGEAGKQRTLRAIRGALIAALRTAAKHRSAFLASSCVGDHGPGCDAWLHARVSPADAGESITLRCKSSGRLVDFTPQQPPTFAVRPARRVPLPSAYAVPRSLRWVNELLARHGIHPNDSISSGLVEITVARSDMRRSYSRQRRWHSIEPARHLLDDYNVYSCQTVGRFLALLLEARSPHGVSRHSTLRSAMPAGDSYPILRVIEARNDRSLPLISTAR